VIGERRKVLSAIVVTLTVALLLTMSMPVAHATPPTTISGQILITGATVYEVRLAGESDNRFVNLSLRGRFTGGISGSYTSESKWIRHDVGTPDVWTIAHGLDIMPTATVMGKTGGLVILIQGSSPGGGRPVEVAGYTWRIVGGTGDLEGLHGHGTAILVSEAVVSYEGEVHFDP